MGRVSTTPINPYGTYQPTYYQNNVQPISQPSQQNGVISISGGEQAALNCELSPNSTVLLMSLDTGEMFMKGTDANGMMSLFRSFDISEKLPTYQRNLVREDISADLNNYASKDDVLALSKEIQDLRQFIEDLTAPSSNVKG